MKTTIKHLKKIVREALEESIDQSAKTRQALQNAVRTVAPDAVFDEDPNDGQIVIATGLRVSEDGESLEPVGGDSYR